MRIWFFAVFFPLVIAGLLFFNWPLKATVSIVPVERGRAVDEALGVVKVVAKQDIVLRAPAAGQVINGGVIGASLPQKVDALTPLIQLNTAHLDQQIQAIEKELMLLKEACGGEVASASVSQLEDEMRLKMQSLQAQKDHYSLVSPFPGMVVESYVALGDWVEPGMPIARILSQDQLLQAQLDEAHFKALKVGQEAHLYFSSRPDEVLKGKVEALPAIADAATRSLRVPIGLDLPEGYLLPGMTGQVSIVKSQHPEALLVPRRAVWGDQVWVFAEGRVHARSIKTGFKGLHYIEVTDGLKEGDQIVTDELQQCREGQRVKVRTMAAL